MENMDLITICVSLVIGILGIAYPILLQVISSLDEKYKSSVIVELFSSEPVLKRFRLTLYIAVAAIILWGLQIPPLVTGELIDKILPGSGLIVAVAATLFLVVFFFMLVEKIFIYHAAVRVIDYMMREHEKAFPAGDFRHFIALQDILFSSIHQVNEPVAKNISDYLYRRFKAVRDQQTGKAIEYPAPYYRLVYNILLELNTKPDLRLRYLSHRASSGVWLIGEMNDGEISETTYSWLWQIMRQVIEQKQDDLVMDLWEHADSHAAFQLDIIHPEYSADYRMIVNQEQIDKRRADRLRFEEFFIALGGLLLYRSRIDCINSMFRHTRSIPPRYELLPQTLTDVMYWFNRFIDRYDIKFSWMSSRYSFPGLTGIGNDGLIKTSIARYVALLFLRQYSIVPYLITMTPLALPAVPKTQAEKSEWLGNLPILAELVLELYKDRDTMKAVGLGFLDDNWCITNNHPNPQELLEQIRHQLEQSIGNALQQQQPAPEKVARFMEATNEILSTDFAMIDQLNSGSPKQGVELQKWFVKGRNQIMDKIAFADDQDADYLNFHSFLAESLSTVLRQSISEVLWRCKTSLYLIKEDQIKEALEKLNLRHGRFVVAVFGFSEAYFAERVNFSEPSVRFIFFENSISQVAGYGLFIFKEEEMPYIRYQSPSEEWRAEYELTAINEQYQLYGSVVDLNEKEALRASLQPEAGAADLRKSVLQCIFFTVEWQFRQGFPCVFLPIIMPHRQQGTSSNIEDIQPFE